MCKFFIEPPPDTQLNERRKGEKEEYGLLCAVICCAQGGRGRNGSQVVYGVVFGGYLFGTAPLPPPHHLPPTLRAISPAHSQGYQD